MGGHFACNSSLTIESEAMRTCGWVLGLVKISPKWLCIDITNLDCKQNDF